MAKRRQIVKKKPARKIGPKTTIKRRPSLKTTIGSRRKPSGGKLLYDAQIGLGLNKMTDVSRY